VGGHHREDASQSAFERGQKRFYACWVRKKGEEEFKGRLTLSDGQEKDQKRDMWLKMKL
jgi:hypothetical protein